MDARSTTISGLVLSVRPATGRRQRSSIMLENGQIVYFISAVARLRYRDIVLIESVEKLEDFEESQVFSETKGTEIRIYTSQEKLDALNVVFATKFSLKPPFPPKGESFARVIEKLQNSNPVRCVGGWVCFREVERANGYTELRVTNSPDTDVVCTKTLRLVQRAHLLFQLFFPRSVTSGNFYAASGMFHKYAWGGLVLFDGIVEALPVEGDLVSNRICEILSRATPGEGVAENPPAEESESERIDSSDSGQEQNRVGISGLFVPRAVVPERPRYPDLDPAETANPPTNAQRYEEIIEETTISFQTESAQAPTDSTTVHRRTESPAEETAEDNGEAPTKRFSLFGWGKSLFTKNATTPELMSQESDNSSDEAHSDSEKQSSRTKERTPEMQELGEAEASDKESESTGAQSEDSESSDEDAGSAPVSSAKTRSSTLTPRTENLMDEPHLDAQPGPEGSPTTPRHQSPAAASEDSPSKYQSSPPLQASRSPSSSESDELMSPREPSANVAPQDKTPGSSPGRDSSTSRPRRPVVFQKRVGTPPPPKDTDVNSIRSKPPVFSSRVDADGIDFSDSSAHEDLKHSIDFDSESSPKKPRAEDSLLDVDGGRAVCLLYDNFWDADKNSKRFRVMLCDGTKLFLDVFKAYASHFRLGDIVCVGQFGLKQINQGLCLYQTSSSMLYVDENLIKKYKEYFISFFTVPKPLNSDPFVWVVDTLRTQKKIENVTTVIEYASAKNYSKFIELEVPSLPSVRLFDCAKEAFTLLFDFENPASILVENESFRQGPVGSIVMNGMLKKVNTALKPVDQLSTDPLLDGDLPSQDPENLTENWREHLPNNPLASSQTDNLGNSSATSVEPNSVTSEFPARAGTDSSSSSYSSDSDSINSDSAEEGPGRINAPKSKDIDNGSTTKDEGAAVSSSVSSSEESSAESKSDDSSSEESESGQENPRRLKHTKSSGSEANESSSEDSSSDDSNSSRPSTVGNSAASEATGSGTSDTSSSDSSDGSDSSDSDSSDSSSSDSSSDSSSESSSGETASSEPDSSDQASQADSPPESAQKTDKEDLGESEVSSGSSASLERVTEETNITIMKRDSNKHSTYDTNEYPDAQPRTFVDESLDTVPAYSESDRSEAESPQPKPNSSRPASSSSFTDSQATNDPAYEIVNDDFWFNHLVSD